MSKYKVGDKVHYTNANGFYIGWDMAHQITLH